MDMCVWKYDEEAVDVCWIWEKCWGAGLANHSLRPVFLLFQGGENGKHQQRSSGCSLVRFSLGWNWDPGRVGLWIQNLWGKPCPKMLRIKLGFGWGGYTIDCMQIILTYLLDSIGCSMLFTKDDLSIHQWNIRSRLTHPWRSTTATYLSDPTDIFEAESCFNNLRSDDYQVLLSAVQRDKLAILWRFRDQVLMILDVFGFPQSWGYPQSSSISPDKTPVILHFRWGFWDDFPL